MVDYNTISDDELKGIEYYTDSTRIEGKTAIINADVGYGGTLDTRSEASCIAAFANILVKEDELEKVVIELGDTYKVKENFIRELFDQLFMNTELSITSNKDEVQELIDRICMEYEVDKQTTELTDEEKIKSIEESIALNKLGIISEFAKESNRDIKNSSVGIYKGTREGKVLVDYIYLARLLDGKKGESAQREMPVRHLSFLPSEIGFYGAFTGTKAHFGELSKEVEEQYNIKDFLNSWKVEYII